MNHKILDAILEANQLGAKGIQVIGYSEPQSAAETPNFVLLVQTPEQGTTSEPAWYDK